MRAWASDQNTLMLRHSSRSRPLNDSMKRIAPRLARRNKQHPRTRAGPFRRCGSDHLRSVVEPQYPRRDAAVRYDVVEFVGQPLGRDGSLHETAEAFAGVPINGG